MKKLLEIPERNDPFSSKINPAEKILHLSRYEYAANIINRSGGIQTNQETTILDIACGAGYGSSILQNKTNLKVIGVDLDPTLVKSLTKVNKNKKIKFVQSNIKSLSFPDNFLDYIVCFETIEHLNKTDGIKAIKELRRVLKKNGILIISSPNIEITNLIKKNFADYNNKFHLHEYKPNELKTLMKKNYFQIVKSQGQYLFFPLPYLIPRLLPYFRFLFKPSIFFPSCLCRYFILTAKKVK